MASDSITQEIRAIRRALAERFDNDLTLIVADIQQRQATSGRQYVRLPKREPEIASTAESLSANSTASEVSADNR